MNLQHTNDFSFTRSDSCGGTMLPPPPFAPGAMFPPTAAMLPRGPPQFATPFPAPIFYWPYPSPPVSPTNYYNHANVAGMATIPQQAALLTQGGTAVAAVASAPAVGNGFATTTGTLAKPRVDVFLPRIELDKRVSLAAPPQMECNPFVEVFMV